MSNIDLDESGDEYKPDPKEKSIESESCSSGVSEHESEDEGPPKKKVRKKTDYQNLRRSFPDKAMLIECEIY